MASGFPCKYVFTYITFSIIVISFNGPDSLNTISVPSSALRTIASPVERFLTVAISRPGSCLISCHVNFTFTLFCMFTSRLTSLISKDFTTTLKFRRKCLFAISPKITYKFSLVVLSWHGRLISISLKPVLLVSEALAMRKEIVRAQIIISRLHDLKLLHIGH